VRYFLTPSGELALKLRYQSGSPLVLRFLERTSSYRQNQYRNRAHRHADREREYRQQFAAERHGLRFPSDASTRIKLPSDRTLQFFKVEDAAYDNGK
jgi:hypothetical protein